MEAFMNSNNVDSNASWAGALPVAQGLYNPENEKDSCGVGFIANIKGEYSHRILKDASNILCNMTHRGATSADPRDGDGAGVMTGMPHSFMKEEAARLNFVLPAQGEYAVGNVFLRPDEPHVHEQKSTFESIASQNGLKVLGWRLVPVDNSILGPSAKSKEPSIQQPFVVLDPAVHKSFDNKLFNRQLYLLRKQATHAITLKNWFYICSLSNQNIVYKGQLSPVQVYDFFYDLQNHKYETHFALVHSRFSTNTFPSWDRAQPMRWAAHNGEINTLRGNKNWMRAREGVMSSDYFGSDLQKLFPIIEEGGSDSSAFDNVLELLVVNGVLSLPEAIMMMLPEAWQSNANMEPEKKAWYEWAACLMEAYDGPALMTFSDGRFCGASLDRNGLRPCRYYKTTDGLMICASEVGTMNIAPERILEKGRLQPGKMLLVDTVEGRVVDDRELKLSIAARQNFRKWVDEQMLSMEDAVANAPKFDMVASIDDVSLTHDPRLLAFKLTIEQLNLLLMPMTEGKEALGSMGNDAPLACLSSEPQIMFDYFRQLFAQVTNPPIDPIREEIVMSLECYVGPEGNLLEMDQSQCHKLRLPTPVLTLAEMEAIKNFDITRADWTTRVIDITFAKSEGPAGYLPCLDRVCAEVTTAIKDGVKIVVLSDRGTSADRVAISSLIATGGVHHYLVSEKKRSRVAIAVETAEAREVHHACVLVGYGADMICPYLAQEAILKLHRENALRAEGGPEKLIKNYIKATSNGILKVMSKMGISTLQSYKGAQIFEALGLDGTVIARSFAGTASRIKGVGFDLIALDAFALHERAWPTRETVAVEGIPESGDYHWRNGAIPHINDPDGIANLQDAVRRKNDNAYEAYSRNAFEMIKNCTLRGMLEFDFSKGKSIPVDEVEPWTEICKRFCTGAMSYGSISMEAHSTLSIAMNRIGGKSNSGEGGEDPSRSVPKDNGDSLRSSIKQIASGRFGVTSYYLSDAEEIQIKMAQGAKPGEGGELPGHKVSDEIGKTRHSTPGVGLISPPPHHDIYSIEDLKQLIYDAKAANPRARISVKLVSEVGVGVIASGVAKAKADHILISGHDGGTGASRWTGIKYAGLPWELGLAESHQTLVLNDLRGRVVVQTDGQIRTGRDVAIACLLGAEEWGFATTPLIAMGCTMMRKCHLNTCPVGIATQDPLLREKFAGSPEHVINFFYYVAEELRTIMAKLGFRTINEMVGRTDVLMVDESRRNAKTANIDLAPILTPAFTLRPGAATFNVRKQEHMHHTRLDNKFISEAQDALNTGKRVELDAKVVNTDRALGTTVSYHVSAKYGESGLPDDTIHINLKGSAGQSLGAWLASGVTIELEGDSNDYVGKGLSGGRLIVYPPKVSSFKSEENVIIGNTCLYGATSGKAFFSGIAAERFAVRNSGALAVVEGTGDHGCEYMTGGRVIVLGSTGRNFAAGMSGGIAYVLDLKGDFKSKVNMEMVEFETVNDAEEIAWFKDTLEDHRHYTGSAIADRVLKNLGQYLPKVVKVMPTDYKKVLEAQRAAKIAATTQRAEVVTPVLSASPLAAKPKANEPALVDLEDSMVDSETYKKRSEMVDKVRGFMKYKRRGDAYRNPKKRTKDYKEISARLSDGELQVQAARCMDCGVPFCQSNTTGCPIGNIIPKWNDLVFKNQWEEALNRLLMTNNFPEFTGRVCPAPCEGSCVLGINELPVAIKSIECAIIDRGFEMGWMKPNPPKVRTGKKVAIIGSGPAGLAAADQLNKAGHLVTVYDRNDRFGGLLMYGIPNMKLDKGIVQRRIDLMAAEGINFVPNTHVGVTTDVNDIRSQNDALVLATGATWPRDLPIANRNLDGIHFAMEFLQLNTQSLLDSELNDGKYISAKGKHVVVIGGGDTGCDCIATSLRHGAASIVNFELLPQPPATRAKDNPWPQFPRVFKQDYGHTEVQSHFGKDPREYSIVTKEFVSDGNGKVKGLNTVRVEWTQDAGGRWSMKEMPGTEQYFQADLVLLSMGFMGPEADLLKSVGVKLDGRSNIETPKGSYKTSVGDVFAAGDARRGQSLIVWGINEGRQCAREVDEFLVGNTLLPVTGGLQQRSMKTLTFESQQVATAVASA
ncbi:glutamate synthase [NADH] [Gryganskiella cystojenkinii]|nr:glutamate synthase [NADH] [Gryganskiella cystojenkinii]